MLSEHIRCSGQRQAEWARRLGISTSYLSLILSGKRRPSLDLAGRIEAATGGQVPVAEWIVPDAGNAA